MMYLPGNLAKIDQFFGCFCGYQKKVDSIANGGVKVVNGVNTVNGINNFNTVNMGVTPISKFLYKGVLV